MNKDYLESLLRERKLDHTLTNWGLTPDPMAARWLVPTLILEPRILQFSAQVTF